MGTSSLTPRARADLDEIWLYVAQQSGSPDIADHLLDLIADRILLLARNPHVGRPRDADLRPGIRSFPARNYLIFYRIDDHGILILRVIHGKRDIGRQSLE